MIFLRPLAGPEPVHRLTFTALECFGLCGLFLFLGLFAGYAWGVRATRKYHLLFVAQAIVAIENQLLTYLREKEDWLRSLRKPTAPPS